LKKGKRFPNYKSKRLQDGRKQPPKTPTQKSRERELRTCRYRKSSVTKLRTNNEERFKRKKNSEAFGKGGALKLFYYIARKAWNEKRNLLSVVITERPQRKRQFSRTFKKERPTDRGDASEFEHMDSPPAALNKEGCGDKWCRE